jgi:hypothetical protein
VPAVRRDDIERRDTSAVVNALNAAVRSCTSPTEVRGFLQLRFSGFETDERELWEIPEVREYVRALDEAFPYWFYIADLRTELLKVLAFCLSRVRVVGAGMTTINPDDLQAFIDRHFGAMNQLMEHWNLSESENVAITEEIFDYFSRAQILN